MKHVFSNCSRSDEVIFESSYSMHGEPLESMEKERGMDSPTEELSQHPD